jgi:hypothetical protein
MQNMLRNKYLQQTRSYNSLQTEHEIFYTFERMLLAAVIKSSNSKFYISCMILVDYKCVCIEVFALLVHPDCFMLVDGTYIETSVKNYELMLCNNPKGQRPHLYEEHSGSAQSRMQMYY